MLWMRDGGRAVEWRGKILRVSATRTSSFSVAILTLYVYYVVRAYNTYTILNAQTPVPSRCTVYARVNAGKLASLPVERTSSDCVALRLAGHSFVNVVVTSS